MVDKIDAMDSQQKAEILSKETMVPVGPEAPGSCLDDRESIKTNGALLDMDQVVKKEKLAFSPQWLGGSLSVLAILVETAPEDIDPVQNFDELYKYLDLAHDTAGFKIGVHMDDHHGEMTEERVASLLNSSEDIPGCGFYGLLGSGDNKLGLSERGNAFFRDNPVVRMFYAKGSKISVLTKNHTPAGQVMAVENMDPETTLSQEKAHELGIPSYNHDTGSFYKVISNLAEIVRENDPEWGARIAVEAQDRSPEDPNMKQRWLKTTAMKLAGMEPVKIRQ